MWSKRSARERPVEEYASQAPLDNVEIIDMREGARLRPDAAGRIRCVGRMFPSMRARGRKPLCSSVFVADHLRPAAKKAGVHIEDGQRFGLHNLRHSLSNWLVNKAKVEPKTVQGILRHSKIQTTLDLYTQEDRDETLAAQGEYLTALGMSSSMVQ